MGLTSSMLNQCFPPKPRFSIEDIPDMTGKVVIVTGGNSGIGKETVKALLSRDAKVYMASRNEDKALEAIRELESAGLGRDGKGEVRFLRLNLASLSSVRRAAEMFLSQETTLHILFNNAGVGGLPLYGLTEDGYVVGMGTNVLGHFYLTELLLPALLEGAKSSSDGKARVVNTSSVMHYVVGGLDFNTFKDGPARNRCHRHKLYSQSKFGNVVLSNELARRYGDKGIVSTAVNPGNLRTNIMSHNPLFEQIITYPFLYPSPYGALTQLWAGTSPETLKHNGEFLIPWARLGVSHRATRDQKLGEELWEWMEDQVKYLALQ